MLIERVGQPVTKVVNPLGTVITVSADDEDVSSSQELEPALSEEPPRSVCAEEGPASLNDFESEGQALREHTQICAEMRSTSEPAIDSVPDHSIQEVRERRALCAQAAVMVGARSAIDFERTEAFSDVPTSLSLCAEQGEIPSSPMTQARETAWKPEQQTEPSIAKAKYVVSCDDESVVLMENKSSSKSKRGNASRLRKPKLKEQPAEESKENESCKTTSVSSSFDKLDDKFQMDKSDEDIVHVKSSEVSRKSVVSDDDIEHIHSEELLEIEEKKEPPKAPVLSSDDDLEHVLHTDLLTSSPQILKKKDPPKKSRAKSKRSQIPAADAVEILDIDAEISKQPPGPVNLEIVEPLSDLLLPPESVTQEPPESIFTPVEIIDIDAERQKAEVQEVSSECKILEEPIVRPRNGKNGRRNKKPQKVDSCPAKPAEPVEGSWSCIVRRKTKSPEPAEVEEKVEEVEKEPEKVPEEPEQVPEDVPEVEIVEEVKEMKEMKDEEIVPQEEDKKSDSEQEITPPEKSGSSSDDSKAPAEDVKAESNELGDTLSAAPVLLQWGGAPAKKNNRSKKKKRR